MSIVKIVSGGQTGADRGGLDAAIHCGIPHGGWCPKGRKAEDGVIPLRFDLRDMSNSDYLARTEANVIDSDCTIILTCGRLEGGSRKTAEFAEIHKKPCLHVDLQQVDRKQATEMVIQWLQGLPHKDCVLNVAGSRASKAPLLHSAVMVMMVDVIARLMASCFTLYVMAMNPVIYKA